MSVEFDPFAGPVILATGPCTEPQRELWTSCQFGDDASLAFNESVSLWLHGPLNEAALRAALADLAARHEALNMTFPGSGATFEVHPPEAPALIRHDWSALEPAQRREKLAALRARVVAEPFNLASGPLLRAELAALGASEHVLTLTAHHIVVDGWSSAILVKDLAALYTARVTRSEAALPPPERFSVYARNEADRLRRGDFTANEKYWIEQFSGEIPVLELPTDRPRPPVKTYASSREDLVLDAALVAAVKKAGAKERASLFVTLLGAFEVLLHRLSGQEDIVVGIPAAGQNVGGHETLVGHCVNMLPIRTRLHGRQPFAGLLADLRKVVLDAYDHQEFTFGTLLKKLPITRDASRLPLVQVIFNVDRGLTPESMPFQGLQAELRSNPRAFENFDLFLNAVEVGGQVVLECQYNSDLYDRRTIQRRLAAFEQILRTVASEPSREIGEVAIVSADETAAIARWNETRQERPAGLRVHDLIASQVARTPESVAVEVGAEELTYAQLERRATQVARRLRSLGVKRGDFVGLCVERSFDMFVGLYGILKAGAAYVPLDPGFPIDRLTYMINDAGMSVVLTQAKVQAELNLAAGHLILLDANAALGAESDAPLAPSEADAQVGDPSYVIYTSGSTGRPKGVVLPHRALVNLLMSVQREPGMQASDVVLAITTLSFDIAASEIILPLTVGAKIVLASREIAADGARLLALLRARHVTFIDATPATWRLLIAAGWEGGEGLRVICTGEAMPKDLAQALLVRCREVWNGYGPSETCVWSTFWQVPAQFSRVLIGHPVANTTCHVLDARMQPVPIGVPGELYIGGDGVALGYLARPDLTAERFLPDPQRPGHFLYRTGDLVRWLQDGNLECLGRNDNQVKLRGFRIELGEIEDALNQQAAVKQAAVIKREDRPGDQRLVGYVTFHADASASASDLRAHLKQRLPDYMIPQGFVVLPQMPLTPSGKIDRKALPAPDPGASSRREDFVAPRTPAEELVASLWREALGLPRVSIDDDFFALGGHSLLASQILARLRRDHGVELSFRKMFEAPTITQFAALVEASPNTAALELPIPRREGSGPAPASLAQERMIQLELLEPGRAVAHNLPAAWRLQGSLDITALRHALDALVQRHETLRTTFRLEDGRPVQIIHPAATQELPLIDFTQLPASERESAAMAYCDARTLEPSDFAKGPLFRTWLLRLGEDDHTLFILPHNTVWDGWSFDLFLKELSAHYIAFSAGNSKALPALPIAYADFAIWQRASLGGPQFARQIEFWQRQLAGSPPTLEIPLDRPRPAVNDHRGSDEVLQFSPAEVEALTALGRAHGATLFMVLFAGYNALLHRITGIRDVAIGAPTRARSRPEFEDLIGPFVNPVVLRTQVEDTLSFAQLIERVRDMTIEAFNYQDLPLEALGARPPIVRNFFSLQDKRNRPLRIGGIDVTQVFVLPPAAQSDTMIWFMEGKDGLMAILNFNTALFDRSTAARLLRGLRTILLEAVQTPEARIGDLHAAAEEDRAALEALAAATGSAVSKGTLVDVLQRSAVDGVLVDAAQPLSRQAFHTASSDLAAALAAAGLRAGDRIGLHLEQGHDLVTGLAGVLRAGGLAASLDVPCGPDALASQIRDAGLAAILTRRDRREDVQGLAPLVLCIDELPSARTAITTAPTASEPAFLVPVPGRHGTGWAGGSHLYMVNVLTALAEAGAISGSDTVAAINPAGHELAMLEAMLAINGATLAAPADIDSTAILDLPSVTVALVPTSLLESLVGSGWAGNSRLKIIAVGPPLSRSLQDALLHRCAALWHAWGHPSAGLVLTLRRVESADDRALLGRPISGVRLDVLDSRGKPQPQGTFGTLRTSGAMFAAPVSLATRARWTTDGQLEALPDDGTEAFLHGWRLVPAGIEDALASHEAVARAAVEVRRGADGDEELVAYVVRRGSGEFTTTELRRHLRRVLPRRFVPGNVLEVQALPELATGEVDRSRLKELDPGRGPRFIAPSTPSEQLIAALWRDTLGLSSVSTTDKFFDLGGYSLLCFQMIERIEQQTGKRLHPRSFVLDTLGQLAAQLG